MGERRRAWHLRRRALAAGLGAALLALVLTATIPAIAGGTARIATASTRVLVDTPRSTLTDLREDTADLRALSNRAVLIGNVMASSPVREFIASESGIPVGEIGTTAPLTPDQPRPIVGTGTGDGPGTADLIDPPSDYRIDVEANPAAPILDVFAEAPTPREAAALANGAVDGLDRYLGTVAAERGTSATSRVELEQLGRAEGEVVNQGAGRVLLMVLLAAVAVLCAVVLAIDARRGPRVRPQLAQRPAELG